VDLLDNALVLLWSLMALFARPPFPSFCKTAAALPTYVTFFFGGDSFSVPSPLFTLPVFCPFFFFDSLNPTFSVFFSS